MPMAREHIEREPRCQNSWRPSDGPLPHPAAQRLPVQLESFAPSRTTIPAPQPSASQPLQYERLTPATYATPEPPLQAFKNPNLIPVVPRRTQNTKATPLNEGLLRAKELAEERLPQIWHPSIDDLIRRTAHDYDMVMNYERDAQGGQRWLPEDIATIRDVGKRLHSDIFSLQHWQRVVAQQGDQDKKMMQQIKRDANFLKLLCERVQRAINKYEQKCEFELLRDGVYAQDENGNFYKPTTPQQYAAEGGFLRDIAQPSIEGAEGHSLSSRRSHDRFVHKERHDRTASTWRFQTPPDEAHESPGRPPKRSPPLDFAFQQAYFDKVKGEAARLSAPHRSDRALDGRITKARRNLPPAHKCRDPSPDSDTLPVRPTSHKRTRDRARNNIHERNGVSRRQAKRDRSQTAGRLGKHLLHY